MLQLIDIRTLCFASSAAVLSLALVMTYHQGRRRTYPGFTHWVASAWCAAFGTGLLGLRGLAPDSLTVVGANLALYSSTALVATGLLAFTGGRVRTGRYVALVLLASGLNLTFLYLHPSFQVRVVLYSLVTAGLLLRAAHLAWRPLAAVLGEDHALVRTVLLLLGLVYLVRGGTNLLHPPASENLLTPALSQVVALATFLTAQACVYAGLLAVNAQRVERDLKAAIEECKVLRGILPICATCKKIRDGQGAWNQMEAYIRQHSEAEFTHGICPDCLEAFRERGGAPS